VPGCPKKHNVRAVILRHPAVMLDAWHSKPTARRALERRNKGRVGVRGAGNDTIRRVEPLVRATATAEARHLSFLASEHSSHLSFGERRRGWLWTAANLALVDCFSRADGYDLSEVGLRIGRDAGRCRQCRGE
jgi:hypothetical protein